MKSNINLVLIIALFFAMSTQSFAQSCERQVLSGAGCSGTTTAGNYVSWTLGQPLNGCTIGTDVIIRQGFEQPNLVNCVTVSMEWSTDANSCDNTYLFEFTGDNTDVISYAWDFGPNASPNSSNEQNPSDVSFSSIGTNTITLTVSQADCETTASNILIIEEVGFGATADVVDMLCESETAGSVVIEPFGGDSNYTYSWSNGTTNKDLLNVVPGEYVLTLSDGTGCQKDITYVVNGPDAFLTVSADVRHETCTNDGDGFLDLVLSGGKAPYTVLWADGQTEVHIENLTEGQYPLTVTDANNCVVETSINVGVYCSGIEIVNTFTPNGDDVNDTWTVDGLQYFLNNEVRIYNRWGSLMFKENGSLGQWAGVDNDNTDLPTGAYYYVIELNDNANTVYNGSVTIVR